MRLEIDEICSILKTHFASVVPAKLVSKGLKTIELFSDAPPVDPDLRQLCVYMSDGDDTVDSYSDGVLVRIYLPGEQNVHAWTSALWPIIRAVDPKTVRHTDRSAGFVGWFPGESGEGGGACEIYFEMEFSSRADSCDIDY